MMVAFIVTEPYENRGGVIFADHAIVARRIGADEYADSEIQGMSVRRCPDLDEHKGDERFINRYLLHNCCWWFDDGAIDSDTPFPFVAVNGGVYKNWMCWINECQRHIKWKKVEA